MKKDQLLERQLNVLHYIRKKASDGLPPSVREICRELNIKSTSTVHTILRTLEEQGHITRDARNSRAIHLAGVGPVEQVPVLGRVTAGLPVLAVEQIEGYIPIAKPSRGVELFALRVSGLSMVNAGIVDGDFVIAEYAASVTNGDIVIALMEDEATVKRFFRQADGMIRLQPENDDFEPILVEEPIILGRVVSLVRNY